MTIINKPLNLKKRFANTGNKTEPSDSKKETGWEVEIPTHEEFNWLDNRQDEAIAHISQRGIAEWDSTTEYKTDISYVQGSNGTIYCSKTNNININPVTDAAYSDWLPVLLPAGKTLPNISISPLNGWLVDTGYFKARVTNDVLILNIKIRNGTTTDGTVIGNLPAAYRPSVAQTLPANILEGITLSQGRVTVATNGDVSVSFLSGNDDLICNASVILQ